MMVLLVMAVRLAVAVRWRARATFGVVGPPGLVLAALGDQLCKSDVDLLDALGRGGRGARADVACELGSKLDDSAHFGEQRSRGAKLDFLILAAEQLDQH